jgi:hypothetical protein
MLDKKRKPRFRKPRFNFAIDVEFMANGDLFPGMTKNISRNGLCFISQSCSVDVGTPLQFQMQNSKGDDAIEAYGDISWKRQMGDECHLGLRFKDIKKIDKSDILGIKDINKINKPDILDVAYDKWLSDIRKSQ